MTWSIIETTLGYCEVLYSRAKTVVQYSKDSISFQDNPWTQPVHAGYTSFYIQARRLITCQIIQTYDQIDDFSLTFLVESQINCWGWGQTRCPHFEPHVLSACLELLRKSTLTTIDLYFILLESSIALSFDGCTMKILKALMALLSTDLLNPSNS